MYYNQYPGYNYAAQQPQAPVQWTSPLTEEDKKFLQQNTPAFTLTPTKEEIVRSKCAHRDPAKHQFTLVTNPSGTVTCTICGEEFNIVELQNDEVEQHVNATLDLLNTTKAFYLDMAPEAIVGYYQFMPFLQKLPQLYNIAINTIDRAKAANQISGVSQPNMYAGASFANLYAATGQQPGMVPPQPPMQQPMQQPMMMDPNAQYSANPFQQQPGQMQQPIMGYQPQMGYVPQPMMMAQPGAVVAPPQEPVAPVSNDVTVQQKLEV